MHRRPALVTWWADQPLRTNLGRGPGAWCVRRSGIKEEKLALGQHGGQPRSRTHQAPGPTQTMVPDPHAVEHKQDRRQIQNERNLLKQTSLARLLQLPQLKVLEYSSSAQGFNHCITHLHRRNFRSPNRVNIRSTQTLRQHILHSRFNAISRFSLT
jgi:hypothetical protein